jgi:hypothetical protein
MVFPGLLRSPSADQANSSRPKPSSRSQSESSFVETTTADYIHDESQLMRVPPECPDLRDLNNSLEALAAVFPDVQIEVFREMLANFDEESRLAVCADALLKTRSTWVKGRWRISDGKDATATGRSGPLIPKIEAFRTPEYKKAVKALAWHEFKGLPRSTINGVLAESNYSYLEARRTLVQLSSKSWRYTISSMFLRRKPATSGEAENHPLVIWKSSGYGSITPTIKSTGNAELDTELYNELIRPLKERSRALQDEKDHALARIVNNEQAEEWDATHECACCFTTATFEEFTSCSAKGHMLCFRCVQHSLTEAVFGQGWHSSIDTVTGTLNCLAVDGSGCSGHIPSDHLHRAMLEEKKGAEILHKLDMKLAEHSMLGSQLPLIRCPFCEYAEVDDIYLPMDEAQLRVKADSIYNFVFLLLCIGSLPFIFPVVLLSSFICLLLSSKQTIGDYIKVEWSKALSRHRRRRRGLKFICQNRDCARTSCLSCSKSWTDIHVCNESSLVALRTQVEQAMSMAIKRVCPRCNTSFVKTQGCNKLTCPCGYKMCYVCRKDIGGADGEGYRHFCDHFRPDGDPKPCTECNRCNLWESENTEAVLTQAREEAERNWLETEKRELSGAEKAFLETGFATGRGAVSVRKILFRGRLPSLPELCDIVVDTVFV